MAKNSFTRWLELVTRSKKLLKSIQNFPGLLSLRLRLTLLFVVIFGSTLVGFGLITFNFVSGALQKEFDDALYNYAVDISESITLNPSGNLEVITPQVDKQKIYPFSLGTALILVRSIKGEVLERVGEFGNLDLPFRRDFQRLETGEEVVLRTLTKLEGLPRREAESYRIINFPIDNSPVPQLILQVAVPMTFLEAQIRSRRFFLFLTIPIILVIATLGGYFLSYRALKPVTEIINTAHNIEADNLSDRLPVPVAKDEVRQLALTLNEMLMRIEKAFSSQERFVADASHQLLTPLTIMRGEIESFQKQSLSGPWTSVLQEVDHLIRLVQNLLLLARADAGLGALQLSNVSFVDAVLEAISKAERIAISKSIRLKFNIESNRTEGSDVPEVRGDEDLLVHALFNLIENAIKYSPENEVVSVHLQWTPERQVLRIVDHGPGLPAEKIDTLFQRFNRGNHRIPGHGLGLPIALKIAELHGARLIAGNNLDSPGAHFEFDIKNI